MATNTMEGRKNVASSPLRGGVPSIDSHPIE